MGPYLLRIGSKPIHASSTTINILLLHFLMKFPILLEIEKNKTGKRHRKVIFVAGRYYSLFTNHKIELEIIQKGDWYTGLVDEVVLSFVSRKGWKG